MAANFDVWADITYNHMRVAFLLYMMFILRILIQQKGNKLIISYFILDYVHQPISVNTTLNATVTFSCQARDVDSIDFFVNGTPVAYRSIMEKGFEQSQSTCKSNNITTAVLTVWAQEINNNTNISCDVAPGDIHSTIAVLKIQGIVKS